MNVDAETLEWYYDADSLPCWYPNWSGIINVDQDNPDFDQWLDELDAAIVEWYYER